MGTIGVFFEIKSWSLAVSGREAVGGIAKEENKENAIAQKQECGCHLLQIRH
jgi:hypothetical protein